MGKSKKTRWRTFEISESQDETQTNGNDVKINGSESDSISSGTSQKYSQILGDHHTNSATHQSNRNSSSQNIYKPRGYNNKENFYNQRSGGGRSAVHRSWQRGGNYRNSSTNERDRKPDEHDSNGINDVKVNSSSEPIKFNEDEYTRITTPRQDVLFKKGYLSRMNNNKTASNLSATVNSTESTAASSTITTSDPDSSVSTLSPATTPSMDYGNMDPMEYAPMYYSGYYDENGLLVIPMYNGYNYYPQNGSTATSPVFLMSYPYQYDPFFMTPSGMHPVNGDDEDDVEKTESDGAKENNHEENQNGARTSSSSEDGASSNHDGETKDEKIDVGEKIVTTCDDELKETNNSDGKQHFPIYPNELNGFIYPTYPNGYYNNFYYYNGAPVNRPPKMRRRKRFLNSRNPHHQQHPRSNETTTDYSDDDNNMPQNKKYYPRYHNGWSYHNGFNNHHNGKFQRFHYDQNANQTPQEYHLNVDVQEFYPRFQLANKESESENSKVNCGDEPTAVESEQKEKTAISTTKPPKADTPNVVIKSSHLMKSSAGRTSKKEIIEGIKSMEEQNIDLMASKHQKSFNNANKKDEWNVIKKGKKVKVAKDIQNEFSSSDVVQHEDDVNDKKDKIEETKIDTIITKTVTSSAVVEPTKKTSTAPAKSKKSKNKNKKKKSHMSLKQDGFEIIEPEFKSSTVEVIVDKTPELSDEEETAVESVEEVTDNVVLNNLEINQEIVVVVDETKETENNENEEVADEVEVEKFEVQEHEKIDNSSNDLEKEVEKVKDDDDVVIDIRDEDICCRMESVKELSTAATKKVDEVVDVSKSIVEVERKTNSDLFLDSQYFNDRSNIVDLERDLMENLRLLDDEIDIKSPIINPLYDFPITSAVQKWLQAKQHESFENLFHVQNLKKLCELLGNDEEEDETASDISEKEAKSESDSDYASDFHAKTNGNSPTCSTHAKGSSTKCNKLIAKESFCALM
ncbi:CLUMA_CG016478, isoform A [Clunio marinus]|uniref:CLUMA_CG016478, isoform A n=1 Tax=Clunio marinus TaxID=568069 RepID=A0A1J1IT01_9DIPT|nr:CLUMA_CG016478, isoform A [Clunio marinus]